LPTVATGCHDEPSASAKPSEPQPLATAFDAANCGSVTGRVIWSGTVPHTPQFIYCVALPEGNFDIRSIANPNTPLVDANTKALAGAVVFLRNVDHTRAKPWDLPEVCVELKDRDIRIIQGDATRRVGFVRRGDSVAMSSAESLFHILRGRGASYFSLAFPEPGQPLSRAFDKPGVVELSSGAGYYWANAHLFVAEHPYFTVTDREGRFTLDQVPADEVELVVWHPGWTVAKQERDPENGMIIRQSYGPPLEVKNAVTIARGQTQSTTVAIP